MKRLSINIPTYNRADFLRKNLLIIISQLRKDQLVKDVEINISDNASTDFTCDIINKLIDENKDIAINYNRKETNVGPDLNFIHAMNMATGKYSILFGDDDYFCDGAINYLLYLVEEHKTVSFFLYNRISINTKGDFLRKKSYLRSDIPSGIYDFSIANDIYAYLSHVVDHGGILTFISSVVYKTSILDEIGAYDERCTGSCYSFLYYWWKSLLRGKSLMYLNEFLVRATVDGATNNNYGQGLKRLLVDTEGLSTIANIVFNSSTEGYKTSFLEAVRRPISNSRIYSSLMNDDGLLSARFYNSMLACGWSDSFIHSWKYMLSNRNAIKLILKSVLPSFLARKIKF